MLFRLIILACGLLAAAKFGMAGILRMDIPVRDIDLSRRTEDFLEANGGGETAGDTYGIGLEAEDGIFFWFHRRVEPEEKE